MSVDALLGATVCADTRDTVSSERHIASARRERVVKGMAASEGERCSADEVQVGCRRDTKGIVFGR